MYVPLLSFIKSEVKTFVGYFSSRDSGVANQPFPSLSYEITFEEKSFLVNSYIGFSFFTFMQFIIRSMRTIISSPPPKIIFVIFYNF